MVNSIIEATAAVSLAAAITGGVAELTQPKYSTHWSFYVMGVGALVGVVASIAAGIFGQWSLVAIGSCLTLLSSLGAFYIKRFSVYNELEYYTAELSSKVHDLVATVKKQERAGEDLQAANREFTRNAKKYEDALLQSNQQKEHHLAQLTEFSSKLKLSEGQIKKWEDLLNQETFEGQSIALTVSQLKSENAQLKQHMVEVKAQVQSLSKLDDQISGDAQLIQTAGGSAQAHLSALTQATSKLLATQSTQLEKEKSTPPLQGSAVETSILHLAQAQIELKDSMSKATKTTQNVQLQSQKLVDQLPKVQKVLKFLKALQAPASKLTLLPADSTA